MAMSTVRSKVFSQDFDTPTTRTFWVRDDREGYVYDVTDRPGTTGKQVCGGLWNSGYALMATSDTLPAVVRRELARRRRQVQREMSR